MRNDFEFQFDFLSWEFSKLYRPKFILLVIVFGFFLTFCNKPNSSRKAQILVLGARGADEPWQYRSTLDDLNKAIELDPNLPEAYASRANHYASWSNFLESAKNDDKVRKLAEEFDFDLKAAEKYRIQARLDYQKSLELLKKTDNTKLHDEVLRAKNCLKKRTARSEVSSELGRSKKKEFCQAYIYFTQ